MSDTFTEARLLRVRCEIEHAVAEFQRMLQANQAALAREECVVYGAKAMEDASDAIAHCAPDPHNFA